MVRPLDKRRSGSAMPTGRTTETDGDSVVFDNARVNRCCRERCVSLVDPEVKSVEAKISSVLNS